MATHTTVHREEDGFRFSIRSHDGSDDCRPYYSAQIATGSGSFTFFFEDGAEALKFFSEAVSEIAEHIAQHPPAVGPLAEVPF